MASTLRKFGNAAGECPEIDPAKLKELRSESVPDQIACWVKLTLFFLVSGKVSLSSAVSPKQRMFVEP